jgi:hypothetical protein
MKERLFPFSKIAWILILSIMLVMMAIGCMSCGITKKQFESYKKEFERSHVKDLAAKDSVYESEKNAIEAEATAKVQMKEATISRLQSQLTEMSYTGIVFNTDTCIGKETPHSTIKVNPDGSFEASGPIKSYNQKKQKDQKTDEQTQRIKDSTAEVVSKYKEESQRLRDQVTTLITKDSENVKLIESLKKKEVTKVRLNWLMFIAGSALTLVFLFVVWPRIKHFFIKKKASDIII